MMSRFITINIVCHSFFFYFLMRLLFGKKMVLTKFKDGRVPFGSTGMKNVNVK